MKMTAKKAYNIVKDMVGEELEIVACTEISDSWIFAFCLADGTALFLPPLQVKKDGTCDFWDKKFSDGIEGSFWLAEHGKRIPIEELEKMLE